MQQQHHQPRSVTRPGVFQHLPVTGGVAERGVGPAADYQVDALGFTGVVVVQQEFGPLGENRPAALVIAVISITKRYFTSLFSMRSYASLIS
jgi:hypothetical protein